MQFAIGKFVFIQKFKKHSSTTCQLIESTIVNLAIKFASGGKSLRAKRHMSTLGFWFAPRYVALLISHCPSNEMQMVAIGSYQHGLTTITRY